MSDYAVDAEELLGAAENIRGSAEKADEVADYAKEADPDLWTWGLPGLMTAAPIYFQIADILHGQLGGVRGAVEGLADRVKESAETYRTADDTTTTEIDGVGGELEGAADV